MPLIPTVPHALSARSPRGVLVGTLVALCFGALSACAATTGASAAVAAALPAASLRAYRSEAEFVQALAQWRQAAEALQAERRRDRAATASQGMAPGGPPMPMTAAPSALASKAAPAAEAAATVTATADSITNVQTAGVDEGGIVKRAGDHLVILRRGRLFTVQVGGDALRPVASIDAYAPGSNPLGAWYDELLISGSTVVVVGYSHARGGTELGLFELGRDGSLAYRATHHLRSFDYYSARNYASRLIGRTLVFYSPTVLQPFGPPPWQMLPGARRWQGQATPGDFERILSATRIYRTDDDFDPAQPLALHNVTRCELGQVELRCESSAVLGPTGRVFYVSAGSVYVWTGAQRRVASPHRPQPAGEPGSAVFRIPLDGSAPSGLKTAGMPIDQMSFLEDASGHLNVLLRESGRGEGMWGSEAGGGRMALLRVPLDRLGDGRSAAQREHYRVLPWQAGESQQNRYVGDWLVYGGSQGAWALRYAADASAQALDPGHRVERIEALGRDAVLVGNRGADLVFSSLRLGRDGQARLADQHLRPDARQGETRSHGFYYQPTGSGEGLLGLPILGPGAARRPGVFGGDHGSASVIYLRERGLGFTPLGELVADAASARDDGCKASCVDWYGNARPIFLGERVFALMGYELVEGRVERGNPFAGRGERLAERRRIGFAPGGNRSDGRYSPFN
jgi:hypothetical protein